MEGEFDRDPRFERLLRSAHRRRERRLYGASASPSSPSSFTSAAADGFEYDDPCVPPRPPSPLPPPLLAFAGRRADRTVPARPPSPPAPPPHVALRAARRALEELAALAAAHGEDEAMEDEPGRDAGSGDDDDDATEAGSDDAAAAGDLELDGLSEMDDKLCRHRRRLRRQLRAALAVLRGRDRRLLVPLQGGHSDAAKGSGNDDAAYGLTELVRQGPEALRAVDRRRLAELRAAVGPRWNLAIVRVKRVVAGPNMDVSHYSSLLGPEDAAEDDDDEPGDSDSDDGSEYADGRLYIDGLLHWTGKRPVDVRWFGLGLHSVEDGGLVLADEEDLEAPNRDGAGLWSLVAAPGTCSRSPSLASLASSVSSASSGTSASSLSSHSLRSAAAAMEAESMVAPGSTVHEAFMVALYHRSLTKSRFTWLK